MFPEEETVWSSKVDGQLPGMRKKGLKQFISFPGRSNFASEEKNSSFEVVTQVSYFQGVAQRRGLHS